MGECFSAEDQNFSNGIEKLENERQIIRRDGDTEKKRQKKGKQMARTKR